MTSTKKPAKTITPPPSPRTGPIRKGGMGEPGPHRAVPPKQKTVPPPKKRGQGDER